MSMWEMEGYLFPAKIIDADERTLPMPRQPGWVIGTALSNSKFSHSKFKIGKASYSKGFSFGYDSFVFKYDSSVPRYDSSVPRYDSSVPRYDSSVPRYDSSVPRYDSSVPGYDSSVPGYESFVFGYESFVPNTSRDTTGVVMQTVASPDPPKPPSIRTTYIQNLRSIASVPLSMFDNC